MSTRRLSQIQGYKRDAVNLLVNRITKKVRECFDEIRDFAAFQEVRQPI